MHFRLMTERSRRTLHSQRVAALISPPAIDLAHFGLYRSGDLESARSVMASDHVLPYLVLQRVSPSLGIAANALTAESVAIGSRAPIVPEVSENSASAPLTNRLPVPSV
jgi:hypothetical protein